MLEGSMFVSTSGPKLMVGVPSGYLSPRLPYPPNPDYNVSVGVELAPGLGVSLDGKVLLVGVDGPQGKTEVLGHLEDGTFPQRDTVAIRQDDRTLVDGFQDWQDFELKGKALNFQAKGKGPLVSFHVAPTEQGFRVESPWSARAWTVEKTDKGYSVASDFEDGQRFEVSQQGNSTIIDSNVPDRDFVVTRGDDGSAVIDGRYSVDDFTWKPTSSGYVLQGYYPQQHFEVRH